MVFLWLSAGLMKVCRWQLLFGLCAVCAQADPAFDAFLEWLRGRGAAFGTKFSLGLQPPTTTPPKNIVLLNSVLLHLVAWACRAALFRFGPGAFTLVIRFGLRDRPARRARWRGHCQGHRDHHPAEGGGESSQIRKRGRDSSIRALRNSSRGRLEDRHLAMLGPVKGARVRSSGPPRWCSRPTRCRRRGSPGSSALPEALARRRRRPPPKRTSRWTGTERCRELDRRYSSGGFWADGIHPITGPRAHAHRLRPLPAGAAGQGGRVAALGVGPLPPHRVWL